MRYIFSLFIRKVIFTQFANHTCDNIKRRSDFMAHIGKKYLFGFRSFFGNYNGMLQLCFQFLLIGNVQMNTYRANMLIFIIIIRRITYKPPTRFSLFILYS